MPLRRKKDMSRGLEPLLEEQEDSSPSDLQEREASEKLQEILDQNAESLKRAFMKKEKELFMKANSNVDIISAKLQDNYRKKQEQREELAKTYNNQSETWFEDLERAERYLTLSEENLKRAFLEHQKCFQKGIKSLQKIHQQKKAAHKEYKQNVASLMTLEEEELAATIKAFKEELAELHKTLVKDLKQQERTKLALVNWLAEDSKEQTDTEVPNVI